MKTMTIETARQQIADLAVGSEMTCPCCDELVRHYKRKLNSGMSRSLIWLVRRALEEEPTGGTWIDVAATAPRHVVNSREFDKLELWGFALRKPSDDPDKKTSGLWYPTQLGVDFVFKRATAPSHVHILLGRVTGFEEKQIYIDDALGSKFSYPELMGYTKED